MSEYGGTRSRTEIIITYKLLIMNEYESQILKEIKEWEKREPSVVAQAANLISKPVQWLIGKCIPPKVIVGAINSANDIATMITDKNDIIRDAQISDIKELRSKSLELSDKLANEIRIWACGVAGAEGGATGFFGLPAMVADIPAIIIMALRVIQKTALCYGYECNNEKERQFVLGVMSAAGANTVEEKAIALVTLRNIATAISKTTWKKLAEKASEKQIIPVVITSVRSVAKQLGINITRRKAMQALPLVGTGVGAVMNVAFINDMSVAAQRCYQERWLKENNRIVVETE